MHANYHEILLTTTVQIILFYYTKLLKSQFSKEIRSIIYFTAWKIMFEPFLFSTFYRFGNV